MQEHIFTDFRLHVNRPPKKTGALPGAGSKIFFMANYIDIRYIVWQYIVMRYIINRYSID